MNKKVIIGAGGHRKVISDIVMDNGDSVFGFLDDDINKNVLGRVPGKYVGNPTKAIKS